MKDSIGAILKNLGKNDAIANNDGSDQRDTLLKTPINYMWWLFIHVLTLNILDLIIVNYLILYNSKNFAIVTFLNGR
jgi:hypothetical protein